MPSTRPATSGYARIAQEEGDTNRGYAEDSEDDEVYRSNAISASVPRYVPIQPRAHGALHAPESPPGKERRRPGSRRHRTRSNSSGVDIKAINARLERWAEEIASKFKIGKTKGRRPEEERLEIHHSVFQPPKGIRPITAESVETDGAEEADRIGRRQFEEIVESVRVAIEMGVHPKMISQGSSGSYFARNSEGKVVGVFKPKDEEPYASRNPKWTKWIHRNLFPCFFGRACLIPNLSYVSEAAAYVLDNKLRTHLVPYTDIVYLSSKSFYYDFWDRRTFYRKRKPLPAKVGSFQVFLKGFKDANIFLREHPWPDQQNPGFRTDAAPRRKKRPWHETCRPRGAAPGEEDDSDDGQVANSEEAERRRFFWTDSLRQSFREELEKLVILDYIMRNTDRGLDNWMIKVDPQRQQVSIVSEPPRMSQDDRKDVDEDPLPAPRLVTDPVNRSESSTPNPYRLQKPMAAAREANGGRDAAAPSIAIGAIDNSLSWPWKHPDAWRSFPFGWLFLPVSLIGQPFSQKTRDHFLPLLTSAAWWCDTQLALRRVFSQDSDFKERMFARQMAVMKGQAWNVVETLKTPDHGPLELTRRARAYVWDDIVEIPVAVPLRAPSAEVRRRRREEDMQHQLFGAEEMDISSANAPSSTAHHDLLGLNTTAPAADFPSPNRFVLPPRSSNGGVMIKRSDEEGSPSHSPTSPATIDGITSSEFPRTDHNDDDDALISRLEASEPSLPTSAKWRSQSNTDGVSMRSQDRARQKRRRPSGVRPSIDGLLDDEDLEGDLGYSAAEGMEKNQRKVIVERLENVKTKNPVFTWC
ncbi:MAG: hypothetical protein M1823_001509 [Watsoniomyces obsoletus]|nr:MAG: hypothetical protein M1823_001509 [Watsoniomyces obsoletus]